MITVRDITIIGIMVALIEVCKITMAALPNIELTTFWIIMFTLFLGKKSIFAVPVFILLLIFAGGLLLLLPVALIAGVIGLIKACT